MPNLVHNEQTKLFASFLNNLGVAAFAAGLVIPLVSLGFAERPWFTSGSQSHWELELERP